MFQYHDFCAKLRVQFESWIFYISCFSITISVLNSVYSLRHEYFTFHVSVSRHSLIPKYIYSIISHTLWGRGQLKCDGTRAETRFLLSAKRTSPLKSAGASVQSTTGSRGVRVGVSNAGYTMFRGSEKGTGYPLHSPVSPSLPPPVRHRVPSHFNWSLLVNVFLRLVSAQGQKIRELHTEFLFFLFMCRGMMMARYLSRN